MDRQVPACIDGGRTVHKGTRGFLQDVDDDRSGKAEAAGRASTGRTDRDFGFRGVRVDEDVLRSTRGGGNRGAVADESLDRVVVHERGHRCTAADAATSANGS